MRFGRTQNTVNSKAVLRSHLQLHADELTPHEKECFHDAIGWCNNENGITITKLLTVIRNVGSRLALRIDKPHRHWFVQYTDSRNRPTVVDPVSDTRTPFEVYDIPSLWENASFSFVHESAVQPKMIDSVTVATHPEHGTRIVFGSFPDGVELFVDEAFNTFDTKFTVQLPEHMESERAKEWLRGDGDSVSALFDLVRKNEKAGWSDTTEPTEGVTIPQ